MAITVTHSKVSTIPDGDDSSVVRPSDWNDDHVLTGTVPVANGGTGASTLTGYVKGTGTTAMTASATIPNTDITGLGTASTKDAGSANGVATLDSGGKVPVSQLPAAVLGALSYQGTWNASTNTPTLASGVGTKGYYYVVDVAGSTNLDGITDWLVGDWAVFNGTVWQQVDNTDSVTSVNGLTGAVTLTTTNIAEGTNEYFTTARARASVSAGTAISYDNSTGVITNSAPDQTVALTAGTGISTSGTYPNFTITNTSPSLGGDVVGPSSATDNAIARFDTTTGKLLQNSVVTVGDTGAVTGVTTLSASTSVTSPILKAANSAGGALQNASGTAQIQWGAGGGDNVAIDVSANLNGTNAQIDISPTGTGHVHMKPSGSGSIEIAPTNVGTMDNMTIGATTARAITGTTITATSFVGSGASLTGVVTSVTGTAPVVSSGGATPAISMAAATGSVNGYLTSTDWTTFNNKGSGTVTAVSVASANGFTGTSSGGATPALTLTTSITGMLKGNGTAISAGTAGTDYVAPATATSFTAQQYFGNVALTDGATISWAANTAQVATFTFVSSNRTMGAPTGLVSGAYYGLAVIQNGGSNTLTWNSVFKWAGGTAPTLSTAAGAKDYFVFRTDGTNMYEQGRSLGVA